MSQLFYDLSHPTFLIIFCSLYRCCTTFPYGLTCSSSSAQVAQTLHWNLWVATKHCSRQSHSLYTFCKNTLRILITCKIMSSSVEHNTQRATVTKMPFEHRTSKHTRNTILESYRRLCYTGQGSDPYKIALYKILGRCELYKKNLPEVTPSIEDYLWLQVRTF